MIAGYDAKHDPRTPILSAEEKKVFVDTFTRTGFTGGINWYRNMSRNWQRSEGIDHTVRVPSLMIMAENDAVLPPSAADGMEKLIPDLEKYLVRGSGHWTQQEKPDEVSAKLIEWRQKAIWLSELCIVIASEATRASFREGRRCASTRNLEIPGSWIASHRPGMTD